MRDGQAEISLDRAEEPLKEYRFLRSPVREEMDDFFSRLPEPYFSFTRFRYKQCQTMEEVAEKLGYSTRSCYYFRLKVLKWWVLFQTGKKVC